MNRFQIVDWDSSFFGFKVASLSPDTILSSSLQEVIHELKKKEVRCVYWAIDSNDISSQRIATEQGGFLADIKVTFHKPVGHPRILQKKHAFSFKPYLESEPTKKLQKLAILSGEFSRFKSDSGFSRQMFEKLYITWIQKAVKNRENGIVFTAAKDEDLVGFIALEKNNGMGKILLYSVDPAFQKKGIGSMLIATADAWFQQQGLKCAQVVTQQKNIQACQIYSKSGYILWKSEHFFHFWLS
jgi:dTDP-4-amino-4,6-dideoxy-D-galactose acyltransferase